MSPRTTKPSASRLKSLGQGPRVFYSGTWAMCSAFRFFEGGWTNSRVAPHFMTAVAPQRAAFQLNVGLGYNNVALCILKDTKHLAIFE
jgi:hypothetical protein